MQAVILAGGLGTRLRPLTYEIPKSLVPISGRPFLHYVLDMLSENGFKNIIICVGHLGKYIVDSVGDGAGFGLDVMYSFEKELLDTGGAIVNAKEFLEEEFLVLNGDTCLPIDYRDLIKYWDSRKADYDALLVLYENKDRIVQGNARVVSSSEVIDYSKSGFDDSFFVDSGVQIFRKSVFDGWPLNKRISLEREIYKKIIEEKRMLSYITCIRYYDIGTPDRIEVFKKYLRSKQETTNGK